MFKITGFEVFHYVQYSTSNTTSVFQPNAQLYIYIYIVITSQYIIRIILHFRFAPCILIQGVPLATEPGICLIILTPMKILQRNLNRSTFVV